MPVVTFHDLDEAIAWANDSIYGLASSIFTKNVDVIMRACKELRFGETYVNRENMMENMQGSTPAGASQGSAARTASMACSSTPEPTSSICNTT